MPELNYIVVKTETGDVSIAEDVIYAIASAAVTETEGVAGLSTALPQDSADYLGVKSIPMGIRIGSAEDGSLLIETTLSVRYGNTVKEVAESVQERVAASLEAMTGMQAKVSVHVTGISFEKAELK